MYVMRKFLAISLTVLMAALSLNAGVALHFCDGELARMKVVLGHGTATCGMEAAENPGDRGQKLEVVACCQDELKLIASDDFQSACQVSESSHRFSLSETAATAVSALLAQPSIRWAAFRYHPPPDLNGVSLPFLQVFLI